MNKLYEFLKRWANWKVIVVLALIFLVFDFFILPAAASRAGESLPILDLHFWYTPQQAYDAISQYNQDARQAAVVTHLTIDFIYPLIYGLLFSLLILVVFRGSSPERQSQLVMFPWRAVAMDLLENVGLVVMFLIYPSQFPLLSWITAIFTALKWIQIALSFLVLVVGLLLPILQKRGRRV